jgi:mannose-6-phosphate isomerase-like protein (cupin superfamily)
MTDVLPKVKRLAGSITTSNLYKLVRHELTSYERFASGELKVIGLLGYERTDCIVKDKFSYAEWVNAYKQYNTVKVEGIEKTATIKKAFNLPVTDIHLFVAQRTSYSFKWHYDEVNVFLFVLRGQKRLRVRNKTYILNPGQGAVIPKRHLHRAFSRKGTWALSIGFK